MAEEGPHLDDWIPVTEEDRAAVLSQLELMLESPLFCNSKRYPNLLRFLVEQTLAGNEALLRERLLGVTVFHRPPDYDTNQDTVVRLTASEVRKRIAQYYHQSEHAGQLQIDLRPGSYVPVFRPPKPLPLIRQFSEQDSPVDEQAAESSDYAEEQLESGDARKNGETQPGLALVPPLKVVAPLQPVPSPGRWRVLAPVAALLALVIASLFWWHTSQAALAADQQLWTPILAEPGQVRLVIADLSATLGYTPDSQRKQAGALLDVLRMGEMVNYRDSLALSGIVGFLSRRNKPYMLELSTQATYPDLQRGASVLVGGLDNMWTMRVTGALRYHFIQHPGTYVFAIEDRKHPELGGWNADLALAPDRSVEDYAIVARIFDQTTGRPVLVVAGLGANGTAAAAEFLLDPARTAELAAHAPRDWQRLNMEAVIRTQILDNHAGPPHLVACTFW
jgi:hypothetical protein